MYSSFSHKHRFNLQRSKSKPANKVAHPLSTHLVILPLLILPLFNLVGCTTVGVSKQSAAKTLVAQRGNIVTDDRLSTTTAAALLSAGLDEQACLQYFDQCLIQLSDSLFDEHYRQALAVFSELHYTKAKQLASSEACNTALKRPPLDPYYANAPLPASEAKQQQQRTNECLSDYHQRLIESVKHSYAYLFYDELAHDFTPNDINSKQMSRRLPSELDIQTQDIYNSATNDLITQLYDATFAAKNNATALQTSNVNVDTSDVTAKDAKTNIPPKNTQKNANATDHHPKNPIAITPLTIDVASVTADRNINQVEILQAAVDGYRLNVFLPNEKNYLINANKQNQPIADLVSTYELKLSGLNSVSKRDGFGISFVATLNDRYTTTLKSTLAQVLPSNIKNKAIENNIALGKKNDNSNEQDPSSRIYSTGHLLLTGMVQPQGNSLLDVLQSQNLDVHLFNPYRTDKINILGENYPLAANFSASYGLWLAENQLDGVGYLNLLTRQNTATLPTLFMLEPYDPNKRVIIMLHGLASSPATWVNLTNDIFNDQTLRDNYQVWQIFYPTNLPILENRYQIQELIEATYQKTDPTGASPASKNSVIISHSMGALITRMMVSDVDLTQRLDTLNTATSALTTNQQSNKNKDNAQKIASSAADAIADRQLTKMLKRTYGDKELAQRFKLHPLKQVDTVVFLSAPFRGTDYADRWFTRSIRRIIHLPLGVVQTVTNNISTIATQGQLAQNPLGALYLQNGASQLSDKSSFVKLTKDLSIVPEVTYHSIIANDDADIAQGLAQLEPTGVKYDLSKPISSATPTTQDEQNKLSQDIINQNKRLSEVNINHQNSQNNHSDLSSKQDIETELDASTTQTPVMQTLQTQPSNIQDNDKQAIKPVAAVTVDNDLATALTDKISDGIVPYKSAHLEGAASETIISGGHSIQENPQTILTLRRILHQQLGSSTTHNRLNKK